MGLKEGLDLIGRDNTWTHGVLPMGKNVIPCKLVLKRKNNEQGWTACYKACLFAKGYVQKDSVDSDEWFSPVIAFDVLLLIAGEFTSVGWHVHPVACWYFHCFVGRINRHWAIRAVGQQALQTTKESLWFDAVSASLAWEAKEYS